MIELPYSSPVGQPLPPQEHAISVSLPTWADTLGYKQGEEGVLSRMQTGYPRYFVHMSIRKLARFFEESFGLPFERALPVRSLRSAEACCAFINARIEDKSAHVLECPVQIPREYQVHIVLFPAKAFPVAKQFWQNTGWGISSRVAERYMTLTGISNLPSSLAPDEEASMLVQRHENVGRYSPSTSSTVKGILRDRIAYFLSVNSTSKIDIWHNGTGYCTQELKITKEDAYLYPTGMSAMWSTHQLCMGALGARKSVCFGFPYADTLKILEKWGPGCYFFPDGEEASIDQLESLLDELKTSQPDEPPILALFTEFPSNPLLRSVNLPRLRELANKYSFLLIIDETIGNFTNVRVMPYADILVTSLSKLFSGSANVMGGSLLLNPAGKYYDELKTHLVRTYEDVYFEEDAEVMELNSRDFLQRSTIINDNAETICEYLRSCTHVITEVYYPKWQTPSNYEVCRVGGYGGLFSLLFISPSAARAFFDALSCPKGPSLGTNFTLACAYALLAHFVELDWAAQFGVPADLIRISVGIESKEVLMNIFRNAVQSAEEAHAGTAKVPDRPHLEAFTTTDSSVESW